MFSKQVMLAALFGAISAGQIYSYGKSSVQNYTPLNFAKQVLNQRDKGSSIVHFYKESDGKSQNMIEGLEKFADETKGIFRTGSVDCENFSDICAKEKVTEFPTVKMYPPFPVPANDLDLSSGFESTKLKKKMAKYISDKSIVITNNNIKTFVDEDPGTPKVLLFTNAKKGTPFMYKALSQHFEKTLQFGLVREGEDSVINKYKIKKFPSLQVVKAEGKPVKYTGDSFSYEDIFEFLNVHSQIYVDPNAKENIVKTSSASKPWLVVNVPQFTQDSGNDICLKKDGALCIILVNGDANVDKKQVNALQDVSHGFASKISRGISFYFSWLDANTEPDFANVFGVTPGGDPKLVILNPGKRKRFLIHQGDITQASIETTLDKILGGDARFKTIKGNKLPALVSAYPEQ